MHPEAIDLFVQRLEVPVLMTDLDQTRVVFRQLIDAERLGGAEMLVHHTAVGTCEGDSYAVTHGFGLFSAPLAEQMDALEHFFEVHNSEVYHEVSPLAHPDTLLVLADRGYVPVELTSVLHRPLDASMIDADSAHTSASGLSTRISTVDVDGSLWAETSAAPSTPLSCASSPSAWASKVASSATA